MKPVEQEQGQERRRCMCMCAWLFGKKNSGLTARLKIPPAAELRFPTTTGPTTSTKQRAAYNHVSTIIRQVCIEAAMAEAVDGTPRQLVR